MHGKDDGTEDQDGYISGDRGCMQGNIKQTLWFKMEFTGHRDLQGRDFDYHFLHGFGMPEHQFLKS